MIDSLGLTSVGASIRFNAIISAYLNPFQVVLSQAPSGNASVTGTLYIGTDDSTALNNVINAALARGDRLVYVPNTHIAITLNLGATEVLWKGEGTILAANTLVPVSRWEALKGDVLAPVIRPKNHFKNMRSAYSSIRPYTYNNVVISNGGSGGTPGTYTGGVSGGPTGFAFTYTINSSGVISNANVTNPGTASTGTAPVVSFPSGGDHRCQRICCSRLRYHDRGRFDVWFYARTKKPTNGTSIDCRFLF